MMAAMKSPLFRVTEYTLEEANYYSIRVGWLINQTLTSLVQQKKQAMEIEAMSLNQYFPEKQRPVLFDYNCSIPSVKSFNLQKNDHIELTVFYDPVPDGFYPILQ